jgi:hypothetical protein
MPLTLRLLPQILAICTLPPEADPPMTDTDFYSITRTPDGTIPRPARNRHTARRDMRIRLALLLR